MYLYRDFETLLSSTIIAIKIVNDIINTVEYRRILFISVSEMPLETYYFYAGTTLFRNRIVLPMYLYIYVYIMFYFNRSICN